MGKLNGAFVVKLIILRNQNIHVNNVLNVKNLKVNYGCKRNGIDKNVFEETTVLLVPSS